MVLIRVCSLPWLQVVPQGSKSSLFVRHHKDIETDFPTDVTNSAYSLRAHPTFEITEADLPVTSGEKKTNLAARISSQPADPSIHKDASGAP